MLSHVLREWVLPPGCLLLGLVAALLLRKRAPKASSILTGAVAGVLYLLSIPLVSFPLSALTYREPILSPDLLRSFQPQAIVVLGGGADLKASEYGGLTVPSKSSLKRVAYAAYLAKLTHLPILVTGGYGETPEQSEAWAMKISLESHGLTPKWVERQGQNTRQNATFSQTLLKSEGIDRVLLVTAASHARRARLAFEGAGIAVLSAPTDFRRPGPWDSGLLTVVPTSSHLFASSEALRALLSEVWYYLF